MAWTVAQLELAPHLLVCEPYGLEGTHTVQDDEGINREFYIDHGWDRTFGYAFGTVLAVGEKVEDILPGDFVHFTRHAYESHREADGKEVLFVNSEDCLAVITDEGNDDGATVGSGNRVDGNDH